ncbi:hypothetical protein E2C01_051962 [Portunus trituberculatus]|uniref:Uncharacterized protein n=1 Tax=Portunus trituberculatus TaxID=210409 RepID=A0A5B7GCD7_PORTR|nr:hypothetical protein [Portunus trituberculatus]
MSVFPSLLGVREIADRYGAEEVIELIFADDVTGVEGEAVVVDGAGSGYGTFLPKMCTAPTSDLLPSDLSIYRSMYGKTGKRCHGETTERIRNVGTNGKRLVTYINPLWQLSSTEGENY